MAAGDLLDEAFTSAPGAYAQTYDLLNAEDVTTHGAWVDTALLKSKSIEFTGSGTWSVTLRASNQKDAPRVAHITIGGTPATGNTAKISIKHPLLESVDYEYTVQSGDTTAEVAQQLINLLVDEPSFNANGFSATLDGSVISLSFPDSGANHLAVSQTGAVTISSDDAHLGSDTGITAITAAGWKHITDTYRWIRAVATITTGSVSAKLHGIN